MDSSNDCFVVALQQKLKEQGRGSKKILASNVGISPNHLSDILGGRKNAGQNLKEEISRTLGVSFEQMLVLGRELLNSSDMENEQASQGEGQDLGYGERQALLEMTSQILDSQSFYGKSLASIIVMYHEGLESSRKEKESLRLFYELQEQISLLRSEIETIKQSKYTKKNSVGPQAA